MKNAISILLSLAFLFASPVHAQWAAVLSGRPPAGGAPFNIGLDTLPGSNDNWPANYAVIYRVQASGTGTLTNAYFYFRSSVSVATVKVAVYGPTDSSSGPDSGDALIGVSGALTSITVTESLVGPVAMSGGTVTSGQYYFMVVMVSTVLEVLVKTQNATAVYNLPASGFYDSPPADLTGSWNGPNNYGQIYFYVTVTP